MAAELPLNLNQYFIQWLTEWEAKERTKVKQTYQRALKSLKKYPFGLRSCAEAQQLQNIGPFIVRKFEQRLASFCAERGIQVPHPPEIVRSAAEGENVPGAKVKRPRRPREYVPAYRSGPYALLMAFLEAEKLSAFPGSLSKQELVTLAQPFCNSSFSVPEAGMHYTAWNSMASIIRKGFVEKQGRSKFALTEAGGELARRIASVDPSALPSVEPDSMEMMADSQGFEGSQNSMQASQGPEDSAPRPLTRMPSIELLESDEEEEEEEEENDADNDDDVIILDDDDEPPAKAARPAPGARGQAAPHAQPAAALPSAVCAAAPAPVARTVSAPLPAPAPPVRAAPAAAAAAGARAAPAVAAAAPAAAAPVPRAVAAASSAFASAAPAAAPTAVPDVMCSNCEVACAVVLCCDCNDKFCAHCDAFGHQSSVKRQHTRIFINQDGIVPPPPAPAQALQPGSLHQHARASVSMAAAPHPARVAMSAPAASLAPPSLPRSSSLPVHGTLDATAALAAHLPPAQGQGRQASTAPAPRPVAAAAPATAAAPGAHDALRFGRNIRMEANTYDLILIVDKMEEVGAAKSSKIVPVDDLRQRGIPVECRRLELGDFLWIARERVPSGGCVRELVLDYVVERKRMDDLAGSIIDGRYVAQKFRFGAAGIRNPIYVVEDYRNSELSIEMAKLKQAIVNVQLKNGFFVKWVASVDETFQYLHQLHLSLVEAYKTITLVARPPKAAEGPADSPSVKACYTFDDYNSITSPRQAHTVREMLARHLLQFSGMTLVKVSELVMRFPTVLSLMEAFDGSERSEELLQRLGIKGLGATASRVISHHYSDVVLHALPPVERERRDRDT